MPVPTLAQIAARAGCSKATVSLALRNDPKIRESTRLKVKAAAEELDYRPNPLVANMASNRWRKPGEVRETMAFVNFRKYATSTIPKEGAPAGAAEQAEKLGYGFEMFAWYETRDLREITRILVNRGIRAVILGATTLEDQWPQLERFPWDKFCLVSCELGFHRLPVPTIMPDHFEAARMLYGEAADHVQGSIGILMQTKGFSMNDERTEAGFLYEHHRRDPKTPPLMARFPLGGNLSGITRWIEEHRPSAIVTNLASPLFPMATDDWQGVSLPPTWSLNQRRRENGETSFHGVAPPLRETGATACSALAGRLSRHAYGEEAFPESILVPYHTRVAE